jgi:hypothetical protein
MRAVAITAASLVLVAGTAGATGSGLRGAVMRPAVVCAEESCERPAVGAVLEFRRGGRIVARVRSGAGGRYALALRSGTYAVTTPARAVLRPRFVRVPVGRVARVDFFLDAARQ